MESSNLTCSGVRTKGLFPIVNVMFGILERLLQLITDSPDGLGRLSHSCQWSKQTLITCLNLNNINMHDYLRLWQDNSNGLLDSHSWILCPSLPFVLVDSGSKEQASDKKNTKEYLSLPTLPVPFQSPFQFQHCTKIEFEVI